jgi:hypothetical protein
VIAMLRRRVPVLAVALVAVLPAAARANGIGPVQSYYTVHGAVPACRFTARVLATALKAAEDPYDAEYNEQETIDIQAALSAAAGRHCATRKTGRLAQLPTLPPLPGGADGPPAAVTAATGAGLPAPIVIVGVLAAVLALAGGIVALVDIRGWEPAWFADLRHASAEARYRTELAWAELTDRLRSERR